MISVATGIARILKQEGVEWVSTFPVCQVNNALGREGVPMVMMRDDRYAVAPYSCVHLRYRARRDRLPIQLTKILAGVFPESMGERSLDTLERYTRNAIVQLR